MEKIKAKLKGSLENIKERIAGLTIVKILQDEITGEKAIERNKRFALIMTPLYVFLVILVIHTKHIQMEKPYLDFFSSVKYGLVDIFTRPLQIFPLPPGTGRSIAAVTLYLLFGMIILDLNFRIRAHYDPDTVQGDAQWLEKVDEFKQTYTSPASDFNMIISQDIALSVVKKIDMNLNVLVIGGSGSGKSFRYVGPNLLNATSSFVVTDPSGTLMKQYGNYLEKRGYRVKCLNLNHMEKGNHYNPFRYIHSDKDVMILVETMLANTKKKDSAAGEQIWEDGVKLLLNAIISYLFNYTKPDQHSFTNVMKLLRAADVDENDSSSRSPLDNIFDQAKLYDPDSYAVSNYESFKKGAGKTLRSFIVTAMTRLHPFNLPDVANLTNTDDIDLDRIGDEKTALFICLPTGEGPFNFLASMLYSQLFQRSYDYAENTSCYSQLIIDANGEVVKTYRAVSEEDAAEKKAEAERFLERIRDGYVRKNKETGLYEILTCDDELVGFRGSGKRARKALELISNGEVISNTDKRQSTDGLGMRLPIRVMFLMDEFANSATRFAPKTAYKLTKARRRDAIRLTCRTA